MDKLYLRESTALQICVRNRLDRLRLRDYTEVCEFYNEFEKLITELKNAGATIDKKEKLNYILRTLPSSLCHIGDLVDMLPEQERTVDYVIEKIKMYENREKEENLNSRSKNGNSNVFKVEKGKDGTCYRCGSPGHFQYECTARVLNNNETAATTAEATVATTAEAEASEAEAVNRGKIGLNPTSS